LHLTEVNLKWLDQRFLRAADGSYFAHEPIYGLEGKACSESNPIIRYARIFQIFRLLNRMMPFRTLLDVGGAEGFVAHLARRLFGVEAVTFDLSKEANHRARELFNLDGVTGVSHQLPFRSKAFDTVLCLEVIEHLEAPLHSLLELGRVCSQHLVISSVNFSLSEEDRARRLASRRMQFHFDRNCFLKKDLEVLLGSEDLLVVDQHVPLDPTRLSEITDSEIARDLILRSCPLDQRKTNAQIVLKSKIVLPQGKGFLPEKTMLEMILGEKAEPDKIFFQPPATVRDDILRLFCCPDCQGLSGEEVPLDLLTGHDYQQLACRANLHRYPVEKGVPILYPVGHRTPARLETILRGRSYSQGDIGYVLDLDRELTMPEDSPHVEGFIEEPVPNAEIGGVANIKGWAIDFGSGSGLAVEPFVDGRSIGSVQNDMPGSDVADFFARIGIKVPLRNRFLLCFDTKRLTRGWHTLRVVARTPSGAIFEVGQNSFRVVE
jgi:2-polyprenyl-3-methyl-5-hydroxy-6-metoxy-1,4-benzoquinol methylase/uncharacterized protein YbaR (Trm112 family)